MNFRKLCLDRLDAFRASLVAKPSKKQLLESFVVIALYLVCALAIGFGTGFFKPGFLRAGFNLYYILPFSMIIFPSFLEEAVFRVLLLPHPSNLIGGRVTVLSCIPSVSLYVAWHPLYASISGMDIPIFDFPFLSIVFILGITCTWLYLRTGSIWIPISVHWLTVIIWVFFLGGRNRLLTQLAYS
jgi:predicted Abi (CAAX) family protease